MLEVMVKKVNKEETTVCTSLDVAETFEIWNVRKNLEHPILDSPHTKANRTRNCPCITSQETALLFW